MHTDTHSNVQAHRHERKHAHLMNRGQEGEVVDEDAMNSFAHMCILVLGEGLSGAGPAIMSKELHERK